MVCLSGKEWQRQAHLCYGRRLFNTLPLDDPLLVFASGHLKLFHSGCNSPFLTITIWCVTESKHARMHKAVTQNKSSNIQSCSRVSMKGEMWPSQTRHVDRRRVHKEKHHDPIRPDQRCQIQTSTPWTRSEIPAAAEKWRRPSACEGSHCQPVCSRSLQPPLNHCHPHCCQKWQAKASCCWRQNVLHGDSNMINSTTVQTKYKLRQSMKLKWRSATTLVPRPLKCSSRTWTTDYKHHAKEMRAFTLFNN